jgi:NTP pyrophosphatase (non-canonical NTP hydrolase)
MADSVNLAHIASELDAALKMNRREIWDESSDLLDLQALCIAEEAGELIGAYRRWAGKARRVGSFREVEDEVADLLIVTAVFAVRAGVDLDAAVERKLAVIYSRGWVEGELGELCLFCLIFFAAAAARRLVIIGRGSMSWVLILNLSLGSLNSAGSCGLTLWKY